MSVSPVLPAALRILLVDDEASILEVFGALLELDGHSIGTAGDGAAALALFRSEQWDVVVTDRAMPEMNGLELAHEIKQLSPCTPVILMTGLVTQAWPEVDAVLQKPFTAAKLAEVIDACVAAKSGASMAMAAP
jgi:CheY-like chemotaxis protein